MKAEWWLDSSALPDLYWARLSVLSDDRIEVFDLDGRRHCFDVEDAAIDWLREDEYRRLSDLVEDGLVEASVQPPAAPTDEELVPQMIVRRR